MSKSVWNIEFVFVIVCLSHISCLNNPLGSDKPQFIPSRVSLCVFCCTVLPQECHASLSDDVDGIKGSMLGNSVHFVYGRSNQFCRQNICMWVVDKSQSMSIYGGVGCVCIICMFMCIWRSHVTVCS